MKDASWLPWLLPGANENQIKHLYLRLSSIIIIIIIIIITIIILITL